MVRSLRTQMSDGRVKMRVLVADDDPAYRSLLENLLTEWNYDVLLACDGNEAWEVLQVSPAG